ncbi:hypothetical protein Htur_3975 (plasmid) [Haloterrigena turkmenica DSM 5511]|uniref:Uncharacterized protein n=1 Tax=Haloterrigena turkmenica (strain ATCC 51198 / DSM 5511 / JCM 9101 / NCIMB 13204 / VKM B-1734 / 4k) TaxID=543526 RepID=D2S0C9_HALTV|nr:hypothetical protein [Haloterrigena turkmenica]ADB62826.1 hypothetical protein Htur_3975 [Haloterrigena turkmenica DSM 5511]
MKTAVCAAIIRHEVDEEIEEDDVTKIATQVLGNKRNANRFFDGIVSNFYEPTDHPNIEESDISVAYCPPDVRKRLGCGEGTYASSLDYVGCVYHENWYSSLVDKVTDQLEREPEVSVVGKSQGPLKPIWENREVFERYVEDLDDAAAVYTKPLSQVLEVQDEVDCEILFPDPAGDDEVTSTDELDVELEAEHESED